MDDDSDGIDFCVCFLCILFYIGQYIRPETPDSIYPFLAKRGFNINEQETIGEAWYDLHLDLDMYIVGYVDGDPECRARDFSCEWKRPGRHINLDKWLTDRADVLPAVWARLVCAVASIVDDVGDYKSPEAVR